MSEFFDTMQVCKNGHRINICYHSMFQQNRAYCPDCGEPTIIACQDCGVGITGAYVIDGFPASIPAAPPSFCHACGMPYPWQLSRVANAVELLRLQGVDDEALREVEQNLQDVTHDTPRTQVAALRIRKVLSKAGKPVYDIAIKVIGDVAAATAKSHLELSP